MSIYAAYPPTYRAQEVQAILTATQAGECVSIVGLSGSGKSNLMNFLGYTLSQPEQAGHVRYLMVDCNRLVLPSTEALYALLGSALIDSPTNTWAALDEAVAQNLQSIPGLCLLLDRFDVLHGPGRSPTEQEAMVSGLRALRDAHKYALTYVTATRRPIDPQTELAELFFAHTLWLGPLSTADARWSASQFANRQGLDWDAPTIERIVEISRGYPSFLRAVSEAHANGAVLEIPALLAHPAVQRRRQEFLADAPTAEMLHQSGLDNHPLLAAPPDMPAFDTSQLTAKEFLLWEFLHQHPNQVCEKDCLVQAIWPEDRIFERGVRDDSLAQLVRRLREKIEPDPSSPAHILTIPGRGYRYCG